MQAYSSIKLGNDVLNLYRLNLYTDVVILTSWFMKPGGSMPHTQGLSNNPYSEPTQANSTISLRSILTLSNFLKGSFPIGLPVKILKAVIPSSILAT